MELTIEQALQQGVAAHKEGKVQDAERLYRAILQSQPLHPDANHNLGVLAVAVNKPEAALPLFKTALEANPKIEQFWLSYIDILIRLNMSDDAKREIKKCKEIGHNSEAIDRLRARLVTEKLNQSAVFAVEDFYQKITPRIVSEAARGWLFADSFDRHFMESNPFSATPEQEIYLREENYFATKNEQNISQFDSIKIIKKLNNEVNISKKYNYLKKLISSNNVNLINDSFKEDFSGDLAHAVDKTFDIENLNLIVIGGGVCGLFLANSIKHIFGDRANVLVLDNRSRHLNTREPFTRGWITYVSANHFQFGTPPNIRPLMECFGTNGLIGIPINILEAVLMLSCKEQGVKFYFSERLDYSTVNFGAIDLVFDATGGRLGECSYSALNSAEMHLKIPNQSINLKSAGVNQLYNIPGVGADHLDVVLKPCGDLHYPYIGDSKIYIHMVKITGIPINFMKTIIKFVEKLNYLNLFYVWRGVLKDEINEGLILINLLNKECEFLSSIIEEPIKLKYFLSNSPDISDYLNGDIISVIEMLVARDLGSQIKIEQPFKYFPYVNLNAGSGILNGKRIFPVGDSLFCGHPKMGNGLGRHLHFINELLEEMIKH